MRYCEHFDCACPPFVLDGRVSSEEWGTYLQRTGTETLRDFQARLVNRGWRVTRDPAALEDLRAPTGEYLGKKGSSVEHRTLGERAWCICGTYCYPSDPCYCCKELVDE